MEQMKVPEEMKVNIDFDDNEIRKASLLIN